MRNRHEKFWFNANNVFLSLAIVRSWVEERVRKFARLLPVPPFLQCSTTCLGPFILSSLEAREKKVTFAEILWPIVFKGIFLTKRVFFKKGLFDEGQTCTYFVCVCFKQPFFERAKRILMELPNFVAVVPLYFAGFVVQSPSGGLWPKVDYPTCCL